MRVLWIRKLLEKSRNVLWLLHNGETLWQKPAGWLSYLQTYCMLLQHEPSKIIYYSESDRRVTMTLWLTLLLFLFWTFCFSDCLSPRLSFKTVSVPSRLFHPECLFFQTSTSLWDCLFLFPQQFKPTFSMQTWSEGIKSAPAYGPA